MKTILYIWRSMASLAGVERVLSMKINWLASHGYKVILVTYEQGLHPIVLPIHPNVKIIDLKTPFYELSQYPLCRRYFKYLCMKEVFLNSLKEVIRDVHPDIVISIANSMNVMKEIYKASKGARLIIESHETFFSVMKEPVYLQHPILRIVAKLYDRQNLKYVNRFDRIVALTQGDADEWKKHVTTKIEVIPNPLAIPQSVQITEETKFRMIAVGRLEEVKGFDHLIKAFAVIADKYPQWRLDIYGGGSCKDNLLSLITDQHLENQISILPPTSNIYAEYQDSDFYVLSSHHEGLGMVLMEAMACGIPCVAYNCDYGPKVLITDSIGILVEESNIYKLADAMLWMIEQPQERKEMGKRARKAVGKYEKEKIMHTWEELFNSLLFPRH